MKELFIGLALMALFAGSCAVGGASLNERRHVQDYSRGFSDGYWQRDRQARPKAPIDALRENLICRYAELACEPIGPKKVKHAAAH